MSNVDNAREFAFQIDKEWAAKGQDIDDLVHEVSMYAIQNIVNSSPVDTGRFRSNWIPSVNSPNLVVTDQIKSAAQVISEADAVLSAQDKLPIVYIQNNLPYANRLENGWSKQAPSGMVAVTMAKVQAQYEGKEV